MIIDRKFEIHAVNPCKPEKQYNSTNGFFVAAWDATAVAMLRTSIQLGKSLGVGAEHLESMQLMINRIQEYQLLYGVRLPDTETDCEIDRCIGGKGL